MIYDINYDLLIYRFIINRFVMVIWTDLAFGPCYMGLNLDVIGLEFGQKWFFFSYLGNSFNSIFFFIGLQIGPKFGKTKQGPWGLIGQV